MTGQFSEDRKWATFRDASLMSRLWCWLSNGHEWRYHLDKPRRLCLHCRMKQVKVE